MTDVGGKTHFVGYVHLNINQKLLIKTYKYEI